MTEIQTFEDGVPETVRRFVSGVGKPGRALGRKPLGEPDSCAAVCVEATAGGGGYRGSIGNRTLQCIRIRSVNLQSWNIIRSVPILGDRRTFYTAETDLWNLVSRIAAGRKARELDPATAALRECVEMSRDDKSVDPVVQLRLREMLDFVERLSRWYDQMIALPRSTIVALMKMGSGIARLLDRSGKRSRDLS